MAKGRKDPKGRVLRKGESYRSQDDRYVYSYTDPFGRRRTIYDKDLAKLREKEDNLEYYVSNVPLFRRNGYRQSGTMIP